MSDVRKTDRIPNLSKEEELALGTIIQKSFRAKERLESDEEMSGEEKLALNALVLEGEKAIETLVRANLGLVYSQARHHKARFPSSPDLEDIVQEGMAGIMTAVQKYDPSRGNKFSTVAFHWIHQAIMRGCNNTGRLVRLPENRVNNLVKINAVTSSEAAKGLSPEELDNLIMKEVGISASYLASIRAASATPASLNKLVGSEGGSGKELIEFVSERRPSAAAEALAMKNSMSELLDDLVEGLPQLQKEVLFSSFSLGLTDPPAPKEVQARYGINAAKYRQVQGEAVALLRKKMKEKGLTMKDFLD